MRTPPALTNAVAAAALGVASLTMVSCGSAPTRSAERFCGELTAHKADIRKLPTSDTSITQLITLYSQMGEVAPLDIQADWDQLSTNLKTASTVDVKDSASVQAAANSAYATQKSAQSLAAWALTVCGLDIGPIGGA
ncbi:MAG: hypothetical protein WCK14_11355 [Actinomycetota bacterium]